MPTGKTAPRPATKRVQTRLEGPLGRQVKGVPSEGDVTMAHWLSPTGPNYVILFRASAQDRIGFVKEGVRASLAKTIIADLQMPAAETYEALHVPLSTVNRKAKTGDVLRSDEGERILGLAKLVGQVEAMVQNADGADEFDARAWTSRWLREPLPALGGAAPLEYMDTMEGQTLVSDTLARVQSGAYG